MRKLVLEVQMSVDGYIADADGGTDWMIWKWGPDWKWDSELQKYHTQLTESVDCILLSRQMAEEGFIAHWQQVAENRNDPQYPFASHITKTHKIVFTRTLTKSVQIPGGWDNTDIAKGDYIEVINELKNRDGRNIIVYGGASFVSSLIKANLIDEFNLIVNPVTLGNGLSIFNSQQLNLVDARAFECGIVLLKYSK